MTRRRAPGMPAGVAWALLGLMLLVACGGGAAGAPRAASPPAGSPAGLPAGRLTVFAAASLTAVFGDVKTALEAANPGLTISFNFAGSQQLVTQLADGANADLFASANSAQMQAAQAAGVIAGDPVVFARNRLAIVVPKDNPANIQVPADLARAGLKIVIAAEAVPVGAYTLQMLDRMSADPQFETDFRSRVEANVVSHEDNVKQVVAKVQLGEADAGVVYVTDVAPEVAPDVRLIEVPDAFNVIAEYPIAVVQGGDTSAARSFIAYLLSADGQAILARYGFAGPP